MVAHNLCVWQGWTPTTSAITLSKMTKFLSFKTPMKFMKTDEKILKRNRIWRKNNADKVKLINRTYYNKTKNKFKEKRNKNKKNYLKNHPEYVLRLKNNNKKRREKEKLLPVKEQSWKKTIMKRKQRCFNLLGGKCEKCGELPDWSLKIINLQFHHKTYENGDILRNSEGKRRHASSRILKEVEENPDNFNLLCKQCHVIIGIMKEHYSKILKCVDGYEKDHQNS